MTYDLLLKNGMCYAGDGKEGFRADVAVKDGKIAAVGSVQAEARRTIDAAGLAVAPGTHLFELMLLFGGNTQHF